MPAVQGSRMLGKRTARSPSAITRLLRTGALPVLHVLTGQSQPVTFTQACLATVHAPHATALGPPAGPHASQPAALACTTKPWS